jgi:hypothetical protein
LSYSEQQLLLEDNPEHRAFSASFLFWLSAQEKRAMGTNKKVSGSRTVEAIAQQWQKTWLAMCAHMCIGGGEGGEVTRLIPVADLEAYITTAQCAAEAL